METMDIGNFVIESDEMTAMVFSKSNWQLVKTFKGETAWSDANRWAWDNSPNPHM